MLERFRGFKFFINIHINNYPNDRIWIDFYNREDHRIFSQLIIEEKNLFPLFSYNKINFTSLCNSFKFLFLGPRKFWTDLFRVLRAQQIHSLSFMRFCDLPVYLKKLGIKSFEYQHGLINYGHLKYYWNRRWDNIDVVYVENTRMSKYLTQSQVRLKYSKLVHNYVRYGLNKFDVRKINKNVKTTGGYWVDSDYFLKKNEDKIALFIKKHSLNVIWHPNKKLKNHENIEIDKSKNIFGYFSTKLLKLTAEGYNVFQVKIFKNDPFYHRLEELPELDITDDEI